MNLEEIAERFEAKKTTDGYRARCPVHNGQSKNSLHISPADGKVLVYCHGGCRTDEVLNAAGLKFSDLGGEAKRETPAATYVYRDENGVELMKVHRKPGKEFKQQGADGSWTVKNVRKVIYRYPEVLNAIERDEPIWVVEGEKDVENMWRMGLPATCNAGGADKWSIEHTKCLAASKHVIIVADKDEPGRKHAQSVAKSLAVVLDRAIQIVEVPEGKDASDWMAMGATAEDFQSLAKPDPGLRIVGPDELPKPKLKWLTAKQICEEEAAHVDEIAPYLVPGYLTSFEGHLKDGKTTFISQMLKAIDEGSSFLGQKTQKVPVLYLTEEDASIRSTFEDAGLGESSGIHVLRKRETFGEDWPAILRDVALCAKVTGAKALFIDTMAGWVDVDDENAGEDMKIPMNEVAKLRGIGLAIWVIRHTKRQIEKDIAKAARGSSSPGGVVDMIVNFAKPTAGPETQRVIRYKGRMDLPNETLLDYDRETGIYKRLGSPEDEALKRRRDMLIATLPDDGSFMGFEAIRDALTAMCIRGETKVPKRSAIYTTLATCTRMGLCQRKGEGIKANPYMWGYVAQKIG